MTKEGPSLLIEMLVTK